MIAENDLKAISPATSTTAPSAAHASTGVPIPKEVRVTIFSPEDWESFIQEWASSLKDSYVKVRRFGGAGDKGIDVIGFISDEGWEGGWDNYQCKRYSHPLHPGDIWLEIGKLIYYSYKGEYPPPRKYYFAASKGVGTSVERLLANSEKLKAEAKSKWDEHCKDGITSTDSIPLEADLLAWFNRFDFSIFSSKSIVELIDEHAKTPFHTVRFGGGLPLRPDVVPPPAEHDISESRYIRQLFDAYGHHLGMNINHVSELSSCPNPKLSNDFLRQRERFYHAESLRNFARDTVPEGTFVSLQNEVFHGVIDVCDNDYEDGLMRMRETLSQAARVSTESNPLKSVVRVQDKQGICHQLANEDQLTWVPRDDEVKDEGAV